MNICTIRQNLVRLTKGIKANFTFALFTFSLTQNSIPLFSALLGGVPAVMQDDFTGVLMSYIFSYAIINELYVFIITEIFYFVNKEVKL